VQIIYDAKAYVLHYGHDQRTLQDSIPTDRCNQLVDTLTLVAHMVSINDSISSGNSLLTLGMSVVYQSRILQSILRTRNSVDPDVPDSDLALWEL